MRVQSHQIHKVCIKKGRLTKNHINIVANVRHWESVGSKSIPLKVQEGWCYFRHIQLKFPKNQIESRGPKGTSSKCSRISLIELKVRIRRKIKVALHVEWSQVVGVMVLGSQWSPPFLVVNVQAFFDFSILVSFVSSPRRIKIAYGRADRHRQHARRWQIWRIISRPTKYFESLEILSLYNFFHHPYANRSIFTRPFFLSEEYITDLIRKKKEKKLLN